VPPTPFSGRSEPTHSVPVDSACFPGAESPESRPSRALGGRVRKILSNSPPRVDAGDRRPGHSRTPGPHARQPRARTPLRPGGPTWQPQRSLPHADECPVLRSRPTYQSSTDSASLSPRPDPLASPCSCRTPTRPGPADQRRRPPRRALSRSFHIPRSRSSLTGVKRNQGWSAPVVLPTDPWTLLK
jgi:hypothetical protein